MNGVRTGRLTRHADDRGSFRELWRASRSADPDVPPFVQANLSTSAAGVLRGLHYHRRQVDYWVVSAGRAFVEQRFRWDTQLEPLASLPGLRGLFQPEGARS